MIRPLRQRHRRVFIVLGIFLPVALAIGITARKPMPVTTESPKTMAGAERFGEPVWQRMDLFEKAPVEAVLLRDPKEMTRLGIKLSPLKDFVKPDLLVYWIATGPKSTDALPADAVLLGKLRANLSLPASAVKTGGSLVLYGVADAEVVDVSKPIAAGDLTR
jgi:hypothetical protein